MIRDIEKFKKSLEKHHKWALDYFNIIKGKIIKAAEYWKKKGKIDKYKVLMTEANKMKFQFDKKEIVINYGSCTKLDKEVSFIPNTYQLETQDCFKHRLDFLTEEERNKKLEIN